MKFGAPHLVLKTYKGWALKDLTHLEQIPKAFSVWSELLDLLVLWKIQLLDGVALFNYHILTLIYNRFIWIDSKFTNFCHFFRKKSLCLQFRHFAAPRGEISLQVTRQISTKVNKSPTLSKMSTKNEKMEMFTLKNAPLWYGILQFWEYQVWIW